MDTNDDSQHGFLFFHMYYCEGTKQVLISVQVDWYITIRPIKLNLVCSYKF